MYVKIKDGSKIELDSGAKVIDVASKISEGLARNAIAGKVNGKLCQLSSAVKANDLVEIVTLKDKEGLEIFRHSTAHILALAVKRKFPGTKISIGPAIENGFYYDFDFPEPVGNDDLGAIEEEMARIIKGKIPFVREEISRDDAIKLFKKLDEPYKLAILAEIPKDEVLTIYKLGELVDLCRGLFTESGFFPPLSPYYHERPVFSRENRPKSEKGHPEQKEGPRNCAKRRNERGA